MAQPYIGEIRMFAGNFAPAGWEFCHGQLLPISENDVLFQLIGTTYGGDGESTFAMPDLRGRLPLHQGNGYVQAVRGGVEEVTLSAQQIPAHTHEVRASRAGGTQHSPAHGVLAVPPGLRPYAEATPDVSLAPTALGFAGGSQPHTNLQPSLCLNFIISLYGIFPSQT